MIRSTLICGLSRSASTRKLGERFPAAEPIPVNLQLQAIGQVVRQWHASDIIGQDPGLADVIYGVLSVLARHLLISGGYDAITQAGHEEEYTITSYGEWFLARLAEPGCASIL